MVALSSFEYLLTEILGTIDESAGKGGGEFERLENMGYEVGYRLSESLSVDAKLLGSDPLDVVKFICKEFWLYCFRKKIDKLQTNHRGVFVLSDHDFKWLDRYCPEDEVSVAAAGRMMRFPCGLLRGALANLGLTSIVSADFSAHPIVNFNCKLKA